jgi:hypothetical protein
MIILNWKLVPWRPAQLEALVRLLRIRLETLQFDSSPIFKFKLIERIDLGKILSQKVITTIFVLLTKSKRVEVSRESISLKIIKNTMRKLIIGTKKHRKQKKYILVFVTYSEVIL